MTKTKALAIAVIVIGTLLYLKTVYFPALPPWEQFQKAGVKSLRQKRYDDAERNFRAALQEAEAFPKEDWRLAFTLGQLAETYRIEGKFKEAEPYLKRLLENEEQVYGRDHPNIAARLNNLAINYQAQGQLAEAEPLFQRAWLIWEKTLGPDNELVLVALKRYVDVLTEMGKTEEAARLAPRLKGAPPGDQASGPRFSPQ